MLFIAFGFKMFLSEKWLCNSDPILDDEEIDLLFVNIDTIQAVKVK